MSGPGKTAIVTGASQGIGAGIAKRSVERGFNVVANSLNITQSTEVADFNQVALVDGDIGNPATAARIVETVLSRFNSIDVLVNNAGIFFTEPFTDTRPTTSSRSSRRTSRASCTSPSSPSSKCWRRRPAGVSSRSARPLLATRSGASWRRCRNYNLEDSGWPCSTPRNSELMRPDRSRRRWELQCDVVSTG